MYKTTKKIFLLGNYNVKSDQKNLEELYESLLLEQPHMNFDLNNHEILFDPQLEELSFDEGVEKFKNILKGELIYGKHNSEIQLPSDLRQTFCKELVNDTLFMNFIKGWAARRSTQSKTYTVDRFLRNTGINKFL